MDFLKDKTCYLSQIERILQISAMKLSALSAKSARSFKKHLLKTRILKHKELVTQRRKSFDSLGCKAQGFYL